MLLAVDIGNTNIHVGIFEKNRLLTSFCIGTSFSRSGDEYALTLKSLIEAEGYNKESFDGAIIGSVSPNVTEKIKYAIQKITGIAPLLVGPGLKTGYPIKLDDPSQLGADLAANTAGATERVGFPVIIVDFGTATTISAVDKDKAYAGCYIMPGIQMSLNALNNTGLLPSVVADEDFPVLAKNSVDSMKAGVVFGEVMATEGFIETYKRELDLKEDTPIIVTGGFAPRLLSYFKPKVTYIDNLTLIGLNSIYNTNKKKQRSNSHASK